MIWLIALISGGAFGLSFWAALTAARALRSGAELKANVVELLDDTVRLAALTRNVLKDYPTREQWKEIFRSFAN